MRNVLISYVFHLGYPRFWDLFYPTVTQSQMCLFADDTAGNLIAQVNQSTESTDGNDVL